ncbi:MAG: hypothetical protein P4N24_22520 [Acidobacteriota bacterium]|nr:hypothetical protein [Acidobacteriota bacterium]
MAVFASLVLLSMATILVVDGRSLFSYWPMIEEGIQQIMNEGSDLRGRDATRSVIIAEYRYRELHPKLGFTCDLESLEPLGGPAKGDNPYVHAKANQHNIITIDIFTLSLRACQGVPVTKYEVSTVPDPTFGTELKKAVAYCSDGSGSLYSAADGKSETCMSSRTPSR